MHATPTFSADSKIAKIAEAYAKDAVVLAAGSFRTTLDWTDASIAKVEAILHDLRESMPTPKPPDEAIWNFAKGFGSYLGEVLRKNHGGEWGIIKDGANNYPGIRLGKDKETLVWPWARVHKRIVEGSQNNVWHYYKVLIGE